MKILITGSLGFIGFRLCEMLLQRGHQVHGVDGMEDAGYSLEARLKNLAQLEKYPHFSFLRDYWPSKSSKDLLFDESLETVVNLAALPGLNTSWAEPEKLFLSNTALVQDLLNSMKIRVGDLHLVHASTSSVYGEAVPEYEDGNLAPVSPYGISKLAAENLIGVYSQYLSLPPAVLRLFSIYGPGQRSDMGYHKFIQQALGRKAINITGSMEQSRKNTFIDDAAMAFVLVIENRIGGTYNVVGDEEIRLDHAVSAIVDLTGHSGELSRLPSRFGEQNSTNGSNAKLKNFTGWRPATNFMAGITKQVEWQRGMQVES